MSSRKKPRNLPLSAQQLEIQAFQALFQRLFAGAALPTGAPLTPRQLQGQRAVQHRWALAKGRQAPPYVAGAAGLELFDRPISIWKKLSAPRELYVAELAAAKSAGTGPSLESLEHEPGIDPRALHHLLARRYWQWSRPAFLAAAGALTTDELDRLAKFPKLHKQPQGEIR